MDRIDNVEVPVTLDGIRKRIKEKSDELKNSPEKLHKFLGIPSMKNCTAL